MNARRKYIIEPLIAGNFAAFNHLLGRDLTPDEARLVTQIVRRIAALLLLGPELDANYRAVSADG